MKRTIILVLGTMLAISISSMAETAAEERVRKVATLYQQGVSALKEGDSGTAAECFREVLSLQPSHGNARYQLLRIGQTKPGLAAKMRQRKLTQIKIPKVNFDETTFSDAIEALDILIRKETGDEFSANFVVQDPHGMLEDKVISMKLGAVPANVVLEYVLKMANATVRYDEHAIVISPIGKPPKAAAEDSGEGRKAPGSEDPFGG